MRGQRSGGGALRTAEGTARAPGWARGAGEGDAAVAGGVSSKIWETRPPCVLHIYSRLTGESAPSSRRDRESGHSLVSVGLVPVPAVSHAGPVGGDSRASTGGDRPRVGSSLPRRWPQFGSQPWVLHLVAVDAATALSLRFCTDPRGARLRRALPPQCFQERTAGAHCAPRGRNLCPRGA